MTLKRGVRLGSVGGGKVVQGGDSNGIKFTMASDRDLIEATSHC